MSAFVFLLLAFPFYLMVNGKLKSYIDMAMA